MTIPTTKTTLRPHQAAAIEAATNGLAEHDRGQLIMACGTGKTITAIKLAEVLETGRVLVLVPNLSLLAQTYREWQQHSATPFRTIAVCSDQTVTGCEADDLDDLAALADIPVPVTTDPDVAAAALAARVLGRTVVFATYQSAGVISAAQTMGAPAFDLALADEAHRTAGNAAQSSFGLVLEAHQIRATKRVFLTATPRFCTDGGASMDDYSTYGPVFFSFDFGQAINADLLCPYQVVVVGITDEQVRAYLQSGSTVLVDGETLEGPDAAAMVAVLKTMDHHHLSRLLTFHSRVDGAEHFAARLPRVARWMGGEEYAAQLTTGHVNGQMSASERTAELAALRTVAPGQRRVLTNARCLTEGVDVPAIDGVAFINPRSSQVDIIQAAGRALRKAPGKTVGTILLVVYLGPGEDPDDVVSSSAFADIWNVLQVLQDNDPDFGAALAAARPFNSRRGDDSDAIWDSLPAERDTSDVATTTTAAGGTHADWNDDMTQAGPPDRPRRGFRLDLPGQLAGPIHAALCARLLMPARNLFQERLAAVTDFAGVHGRLPTERESLQLYRFMTEQRRRRRRRTMTPEDAAALEALPGWTWEPAADAGQVRARAIELHAAGLDHAQLAEVLEGEIENLGGRRTRWTTSRVQQLLTSRAEYRTTTVSRDERWEAKYRELSDWIRQHGPLQERNTGMSRSLSQWMADQKRTYRASRHRLTAQRIPRLEALPGWTWGEPKTHGTEALAA